MTPRASLATVTAQVHLVRLPRVDEPRGSLCVAEGLRDVPFPIARVYWIHGVPADGERARHAHRTQYQMLVAVQGSFTVHCDTGSERTRHRLDTPETGLVLEPMVFHYLDEFSPEAVCLVLASGPYDRDEYIETFEEFAALAGGHTNGHHTA